MLFHMLIVDEPTECSNIPGAKGLLWKPSSPFAVSNKFFFFGYSDWAMSLCHAWAIQDRHANYFVKPFYQTGASVFFYLPASIYFFQFLFFLMWTIFKVCIEFATVLLLFYVLVFWPQACGTLAAQPGSKPKPHCTGRWSLNPVFSLM